MTDYSESLIKITALVKQYRKLVLKGEFDAAADVAVDMQIAVVDLQEWSEAQCTETPTLSCLSPAAMPTLRTEDGTVVAAHSNQLADGKGKGIKASDYRIAALCFSCHMDLDQGNKLSKDQRREFWEMAHRRTIGELFERNLIKC